MSCRPLVLRLSDLLGGWCRSAQNRHGRNSAASARTCGSSAAGAFGNAWRCELGTGADGQRWATAQTHARPVACAGLKAART